MSYQKCLSFLYRISFQSLRDKVNFAFAVEKVSIQREMKKDGQQKEQQKESIID